MSQLKWFSWPWSGNCFIPQPLRSSSSLGLSSPPLLSYGCPCARARPQQPWCPLRILCRLFLKLNKSECSHNPRSSNQNVSQWYFGIRLRNSEKPGLVQTENTETKEVGQLCQPSIFKRWEHYAEKEKIKTGQRGKLRGRQAQLQRFVTFFFVLEVTTTSHDIYWALTVGWELFNHFKDDALSLSISTIDRWLRALGSPIYEGKTYPYN